MTELSSVSGLRGVREALQKWQRKYFSAGISHEMWPKAVEHAFEAGWTAALSLPPSPQADDLESISAQVHEQWMENKRKAGVSSRKLESGEELMVPYEQLTETAKELDRGSVRAVLSAQEALRSSPAGAQGQVQGVQHSLRGRLKEAIKEREIAERVATAITIVIRRPDWDQPEWKEWVIGCIEDELLNIGDEGFAKAYDQGFDNGLKEAMSEAPPADVSSQAGQPRQCPNCKSADLIQNNTETFKCLGCKLVFPQDAAMLEGNPRFRKYDMPRDGVAAPSAGSGQEGLASGLVWSGPQGHLATCKYPSGGDCDCGWLFYCRRPINRAALLPPASKPPVEQQAQENFPRVEGHRLLESDLVGWWGRCSCGWDCEFAGDWTGHLRELLRRASLERESRP